MKLKKWYYISMTGRLYAHVLVVLSILSCFQYIVQTYYNERDEADSKILEWFSIVETVMAFVFFVDWCLMYYIADHKIEFFNSFYSMIDIFTIIPTAFLYGSICPYPDEISAFWDFWIYVMSAATTMRVLRILRLQRCICVRVCLIQP